MSINKWEIWLANLEPVIGSEQGKTRPVVIVSEEYTNTVLNIVNVLPLTTRKNNRTIYPNEALLKAGSFGLSGESIVPCYQIRTIDKKRLLKLYGAVTDLMIQSSILDALKFQLGIM